MARSWPRTFIVGVLTFGAYLALDWLLFRVGAWHQPTVRSTLIAATIAIWIGARAGRRAVGTPRPSA